MEVVILRIVPVALMGGLIWLLIKSRSARCVAAGFFLGSIVNMLIIQIGMELIPAPEGVDVMNIDSIKGNINKYGLKHFVFPFLAHSIGTFAGAFLTARIERYRKPTMAMILGCLFLLGGVYAAIIIPAPAWFIALDLIVAYLPMAWLGARLGFK